MITQLHIQNYAIIDEVVIDFSKGLNIITGETGAGKSILMGALNLILGERADTSVLHDTSKKCFVEGVFQIEHNKNIDLFFTSNDLEFEKEIIVRREISSNGKSRSFINDTPVNLSTVKELSLFLVDLHQQFDTLELHASSFQKEVLDAFAENAILNEKLRNQFYEYSIVKKELLHLTSQQEQANKDLDYFQFLYDELIELGLQDNELELMEAELKLQTKSEYIKQQLNAVYFELKNSDQPIVSRIKSLNQQIKSIESYHNSIGQLSERLISTSIELKDIADELEHIENQLQYDPQRIAVINDKLSVGYKLLKKHNVTSTSQLLAIQTELQQKIHNYTNLFSAISKTEVKEKELYKVCIDIAILISEKRKSIIDDFSNKVNQLLVQVGMPTARLKVDISTVTLSQDGFDEITFLFDANKSNKFESMSKVASGGELSRLMLSIKSLVAQKINMPTLVFDEIDTGISGEAAKQVALIMQSLSSKHQIIAITHQPQIAAKASTHFFVYKEEQDDKIKTGVRVLSDEDRIFAIAKMLSGDHPTTAALEIAKEMIHG